MPGTSVDPSAGRASQCPSVRPWDRLRNPAPDPRNVRSPPLDAQNWQSFDDVAGRSAAAPLDERPNRCGGRSVPHVADGLTEPNQLSSVRHVFTTRGPRGISRETAVAHRAAQPVSHVQIRLPRRIRHVTPLPIHVPAFLPIPPQGDSKRHWSLARVRVRSSFAGKAPLCTWRRSGIANGGNHRFSTASARRSAAAAARSR